MKKLEHPEIKNIKKVLHEQQKYWNIGDINGFIKTLEFRGTYIYFIKSSTHIWMAINLRTV